MANLQRNFQFHKFKLDSLRLLIPAEEVKNESRINRYIIEVTEDEIVSEPFKAMAKAGSKDGINFRFEFVQLIDPNEELRRQYYAVAITAKMLKNKYFEGITRDNIIDIYDFIQSIPHGLKFSIDSLLNAKPTDIDYCYDIPADLTTWIKVCKAIENRNDERNEKHFRTFQDIEKRTIGCQFNERKTATPKKPFIKYYHKTTELRKKNEGFINLDEVPEIGRFEFTFKNRKTWKENGLINPGTLAELVSYPEDLLNNFLLSSTQEFYLKDMPTMRKRTGELTPSEFIENLLIESILEKGLGKQTLKQFEGRYIRDTGKEPNNMAVYRLRKKLNRAFKEMTEGKEELVKESEKVEAILKELRIGF